jgi:hypothetical protein
MSNVKKRSTRKRSPIAAPPASGPSRPEAEANQREGDAMSAVKLKVVQPMSTQLMKADLPQQWANRINGHLKTSIESIFAMGRDLIAAKKQIGDRPWLTMFAGRPDSVAEPIRFDRTTAFRFMKIAAHRVLGNVAHVQHLPPAWGTLYQLAQLEDAHLERAITDGKVTPEMSRQDAKKLRSGRTRRSKKHAPAKLTPEPAGQRVLPIEYLDLSKVLPTLPTDIQRIVRAADAASRIEYVAYREIMAKCFISIAAQIYSPHIITIRS